MTLKEMTEKCARLLDMDGFLDGEVSAFDQEQQTLYARLCDGINTAYLSAARDLWRLLEGETVTTDSQGRVRIDTLGKQFIALYRAEKDGRKLPAGVCKDYIHIFGLPGSTVTLYYYYLPQPLSAETESPLLPECRVDPMTYIYYAVSLYYTTEKRHSEAAAWDVRYRNMLAQAARIQGPLYIKERRWR